MGDKKEIIIFRASYTIPSRELFSLLGGKYLAVPVGAAETLGA